MKQMVRAGIWGVFLGALLCLWLLVVPKNVFVASRQPVGDWTLKLERLQLTKGGFVVVHTDRDLMRNPESILGHSDWLPAGVYVDNWLDIFPNNSQSEWFKSGEFAYATLFTDNGDTFFNLLLDAPAITIYGKPYTKKIILR